MIQIYDDAIDISKAGSSRFIIIKGLDMILCDKGKSLLKYLKEGYELKSIFSNGIEYNTYVVRNSEPVKYNTCKSVLEDILKAGIPDNKTLVFAFQTFYTQDHQVESKNVDISVVDGSHCLMSIKLFDNEADTIQNIMYMINAKLDTDGFISYLESYFERMENK